MLLFDEPENDITLEEKAADNKVDELNKIIDDDAIDIHNQPSTAKVP